MSDDIIVVVPPGTRVRYIESPYTDDNVLVLDASALEPKTFEFEPIDAFARYAGLPVYNAEKYQRDA